MASHFQNRLVGISILVASVVIFLPSIIDGKKMTYEDEFVSTPIHPELKEHSQQFNDRPVENILVEDEHWQVEEVAQVTPLKKPSSEKTIVQKKLLTTKPAVKKKVMPANAWTIQLGAFRNAANINSLLKTLHKAGFQAHTVPREVIDGELTRLFVGPDISKEKLKKQLPRLKRLTKLKGKLLPFNAVNP